MESFREPTRGTEGNPGAAMKVGIPGGRTVEAPPMTLEAKLKGALEHPLEKNLGGNLDHNRDPTLKFFGTEIEATRKVDTPFSRLALETATGDLYSVGPADFLNRPEFRTN